MCACLRVCELCACANGEERTLQQRQKQLCYLVVRVFGLSPRKNL